MKGPLVLKTANPVAEFAHLLQEEAEPQPDEFHVTWCCHGDSKRQVNRCVTVCLAGCTRTRGGAQGVHGRVHAPVGVFDRWG